MIQYNIHIPQLINQLALVSIQFRHDAENAIELEIPAWRPGRYEFQNYAKNIIQVEALSENGENIPVQKLSRNAWTILQAPKGEITIHYRYICTQLDAGGSWIDDELIYINPINCCFSIKGKEQEPCTLTFVHPFQGIEVASALPFTNNTTIAPDYFNLIDNPFFVSLRQNQWKYEVKGIPFYIWTHGNIHFDAELLLNNFEAFTSAQIQSMKQFPKKEYHFLLLLFDHKMYHGVEHQASTVITLGPAEAFKTPESLQDLISISSHELYHAWNVCQLKPQAFYPYQLNKENYYTTGFITEGITSYLGEYYLWESGVFSNDVFIQEIQTWIQRYEMHSGLKRANLLESSFDLWVDGYIPSSSDTKVSIYVAGALSAICLDLLLRSKNTTLKRFMHHLYEHYALQSKGYEEIDIVVEIMSFLGEEKTNLFWNTCLVRNQQLSMLQQLLPIYGIKMYETMSTYIHERDFGFKLLPHTLQVYKIKMEAQQHCPLMIGDVIMAVNDTLITTSAELENALENHNKVYLQINRKGRILNLEAQSWDQAYWSMWKVEKNSEASPEEKLRYEQWKNY
jgi:predicted metalloprotease with PDZ domain